MAFQADGEAVFGDILSPHHLQKAKTEAIQKHKYLIFSIFKKHISLRSKKPLPDLQLHASIHAFTLATSSPKS